LLDNPPGAKTCSSCGTALISATPGIATGGTAAGTGPGGAGYTPFLHKGVRLHSAAYAVGDVLGQGGFGITYKGGDLSLRRYVAIKELFPSGCKRKGNTVVPDGGYNPADYTEVKAKFLEEARVLARFSHPGIVRVFSVFEENNTAYMVMEFLEGKTLSRLLQDKGTLSEAEAIRIIEKVGDALATIHAANLIHRDLKPDNICITNDDRIVLIDFGTARSFATGKTVKQTTMLTPGYAPLEQYGQQARFGTYTDIYALAATLYHCLTGQVPPQATDRAAGVELKPPSSLKPGISPAVSQAVLWGMQLKADARPQSVSQFLQALHPAVTSAPAPRTGAGGTVMLSPDSGGGSPVAPVPQWPSSAPPVTPNWGGAAPAWPSAPAAPTPPASPVPTLYQVGENQLQTSLSPQEALQAAHRAFQASGVRTPTINPHAFRVSGTTGGDVLGGSLSIAAQISQNGNNSVITVESTSVGGAANWGRRKEEERRLTSAISAEIQRGLPPSQPRVPGGMPRAPSPAPYPGPPIPYPGSAAPYPGGNPYQFERYVNKQGSTVLTLGLLGLVCCPICGPIAWYQANEALREYGDTDPGDRSIVLAGRVLGIAGTVIFALGITLRFISALS
jgi:serine/threonine protein kinase